jgi:hypothetical protein
VCMVCGPSSSKQVGLFAEEVEDGEVLFDDFLVSTPNGTLPPDASRFLAIRIVNTQADKPARKTLEKDAEEAAGEDYRATCMEDGKRPYRASSRPDSPRECPGSLNEL